MKFLLLLALISTGTARLRADGATDPKSIHKIIFVGDSITNHAPAASLAWTGTWGMAATSVDKDYVHLFLAKLAEAQGAGAPAPEVWIDAVGGGKITDKIALADKITAFHADLALVQLGENDNKDVTAEGFQQPYEKLLAAIRAGNPSARILCIGVWGIWPTGDQTKNIMVRAACQKYGATFADLGAAFANPANRAASEHLFTNVAVNWHPSDGGMAAYADAFWKAFTTAPSAPTETVAAAPAPDAPVAAEPIQIDENWGDPLGLTWSPVPPLAQEDGHGIAKITSGDATKDVTFGAALNVQQFSGQTVTISTRVRADSVSDKPNPWNGVKLMFHVRNAEGKLDYPQFELPTGTFPWTDVKWSVPVPENTTELYLTIGLEKVTGTACYDAIHISTGK
jgi:lysophospholipase L1-like esterase